MDAVLRSFVDLKDDLLYEIGWLVPPTQPSSLVVAALTCKRWGAILTSSEFRDNYISRHGTPPFLGYFHNSIQELPRFVSRTLTPASTFVPEIDSDLWYVLDARKGCVLLLESTPTEDIAWSLVVWNPITGDYDYLPPAPRSFQYFAGAVLCADTECIHTQCSRSEFFKVVLIGSDEPDSEDSDCVSFRNINWASIYSSESGQWGNVSEMDDSNWGDGSHPLVERTPPILFDGSLFFRLEEEMAALEFNVDSEFLSLLYFLEETGDSADSILIANDGKLELVGYADVGGEVNWEGVEVVEPESHIHIWTLDDDSDWTLRRAFRLEDIIFPNAAPPLGSVRPSLLGSIEGTDTVFVGLGALVFSLNLSSLEATEMGQRNQSRELVPFSEFVTPLGQIVHEVKNANQDYEHAMVVQKNGQAGGIEGDSPLRKKARIEIAERS